MRIAKIIFETVIDALFPLSAVEKELLSYTPEAAYQKLPPAPPSPVADTRGIYAYKDERVAKLVWNIKYKKSPKAVEIGGYALYHKLLSMNLPAGTLLIPMPITPRRRRERGYNQCELLLDEVARLDAVTCHFVYEKNLLVRIHHASRQTLKDRSERLESAKGIFSVDEEIAKRFLANVPQNQSAGEKTIQLIVIDDVITTGSTIKEAMETLRAADFVEVRGVSLAH